MLTLKSAWADGTGQLLFELLELLEKLAALLPRPRINLVLYHGVLAPHSDWRACVVTYGAAPAEAPVVGSAAPEADDGSITTRPFATGRGRHEEDPAGVGRVARDRSGTR